MQLCVPVSASARGCDCSGPLISRVEQGYPTAFNESAQVPAVSTGDQLKFHHVLCGPTVSNDILRGSQLVFFVRPQLQLDHWLFRGMVSFMLAVEGVLGRYMHA